MLINRLPLDLEKGQAAGRRLFFMHIPKTAGTAISNELMNWFPVDKIMPIDNIPVRFPDHPVKALSARNYSVFGLGVHYDYAVVESLRSSIDPSERCPFVFTVLRPPRSRLVSQYQYWLRADQAELQRLPKHVANAYLLAQRLSLRDFLCLGDPVIVDHFRDYQLRYLAGIMSSRYLDDCALLDQALSNCATFDLIGSIDSVDDVLGVIAHAYGLEPPESTHPINESLVSSSLVFDEETEAAIADYISLELRFWEIISQDGCKTYSRSKVKSSFYTPHSRSLDTLLTLGCLTYTMRQSLSGSGWHIREGVNRDVRWTGPGLTSTLALPVPVCRLVRISLTIISVLDWSIVDSVDIRLQGQQPIRPIIRGDHKGYPTLEVDFALTTLSTSSVILEIQVPFTRSNSDIDRGSSDTRQKGIAFGEIRISSRQESDHALKLESLWDIKGYANPNTSNFVDQVVDATLAMAGPNNGHNSSLDEISLLRCLLTQLDPTHVSTVGNDSPYLSLSLGQHTDDFLPRHLLISSPEYMMQSGPVSDEVNRCGAVILALTRSDDFRLQLLANNPAIKNYVIALALPSPFLLVNLKAIDVNLGFGMLNSLLWLIQRIGSTMPSTIGNYDSLMEHVHLDLQLRLHLDLLCKREDANIDFNTYARCTLQTLVPEWIKPKSLSELYLQIEAMLAEPAYLSSLAAILEECNKVIARLRRLELGNSERTRASLKLLAELWPITMQPINVTLTPQVAPG